MFVLLIVLGLLLQGVIAPDPFNQFMRQHYNQRGLQTPGTSGLSYTQYSAPGSALTSGLGTPGQVSGISQNAGSNQHPMLSGNTLTFGFETQSQITGFQTGLKPGPKLLPLQATVLTNNQMGVRTTGQTLSIPSSQTASSQPLPPLDSVSRNAMTGTSPQTSNQLSGPQQLPMGAANPQSANQPQPMRSPMMPSAQPKGRPSGQSVHTFSASAPPLQNPDTTAGKDYPISVSSIIKPSSLMSDFAQSFPAGTQPLQTRKQILSSGINLSTSGTAQSLNKGTKSLPFVAAQPTPSQAPNERLRLSKSILQMIQKPPQFPPKSQPLHTGSNFFLPPLQQNYIQIPFREAKPSPQSTAPVFSQHMNTPVQTLPSYSSPPLTYNPSRLEKWAIKSYTDDSVAKLRTLKRKSYLQLIAKRRRALANQQLSQALFNQPAAKNVHPQLDRVMPNFLTLNAARDLDCETIPEVRGLDVHKYHPMGCDDDKCPPGKECRTLRGVGMCCPPSVTSQAIKSKSSVGRFEYLGLL